MCLSNLVHSSRFMKIDALASSHMTTDITVTITTITTTATNAAATIACMLLRSQSVYVGFYRAELLLQLELVDSIGQTADFGFEGNLVWGDRLHSSSQSRCVEAKKYIDGTFGPYVHTVSQCLSHCCVRSSSCFPFPAPPAPAPPSPTL